VLQKIRDHFGKPVTINSAYRTEAVVTLHAAYKQLGGNHYVDELYAEMQEWEHSA
jgi:hypothetical protein